MDVYRKYGYGKRHIVEDIEKASCSGALIPLYPKISLKQPMVSFACERRYLIPLWVPTTIEELQKELHVSDSSQSKIFDQSISGKISNVLELLAFRDPHLIIQYWSARVVGKHRLLVTVDQPFGVGSPVEELFIYRKNSVQNMFLVDMNHPEEDISPVARVFRQGLPEWTSDLSNYPPKDFAQQDCAVRCNLHGYLALPVFDSTTQLCVGVLELLMSSKNTSYAFEVQQIHKELKTQNLTSPQAFGPAASKVTSQRMPDELDKVFHILKSACDKLEVPFAQTWAESASSSFNSHDKMIEKSCSSFDTCCVGKVCMFSHSLPFHVGDLQMWPLRETCKEQHLDKSRSVVGRVLLTRGSYFCEDITQLCGEEFHLVRYVPMRGLMSWFAIWLHGIEGGNNYVLEFLLPFDRKGGKQVLNLVQTLKQNTVASGFELGQMSPTEFAVPPASYPSSSIKPPLAISSKMSNTLACERDSSGSESGSNSEFDSDSESESDSNSEFDSYSESDLGSFVKTDSESESESNSAYVRRHSSSKEIFPFDMSGNINMVGSRENNNATLSSIAINQKTGDIITDAGEKSKPFKGGSKRKIHSLTMSAVEQHVKPISQAAESFGVSRSTLKRFCRENGIHSWPEPNQSKNTNHATNPKLSQEVTVKATFKGDMIKFRFPTSSGLLELKNEVAQRLDLKGKLNIKYKDEENDLLLITCDADLHNLSEFLASNTNTSVKLLVELVSE